MERVWASSKDESERLRSARDLFEAFVLPSRASAMASLRVALESQEGPSLITGEAGVGKTWLWRRLRADRPASWHWVDIELSPADVPADFYRAIGHALGLISAGTAPTTRLDLADSLFEAYVEGRRWVLVVDEAHNLSGDILEEIRLQCNKLGHPGGFAGLILVGQTPLVRRLASRSLAALQARLSARAHLRTLDVEEARTLLDRLKPGAYGDLESFERLHRDAGGEPRRLILLSTRQASRVGPSSRPVNPTRLGPEAVDSLTAIPIRPDVDRHSPLLGACRPPLRLEEGLIEVGWDAERGSTEGAVSLEAALSKRAGDDGPEGGSRRAREAELGPEVEEVIDDPYTAIQARSDRERCLEPSASELDPVTIASQTEEAREASLPNVWAEGQHEFAPYSQLFSRLRQRRESP